MAPCGRCRLPSSSCSGRQSCSSPCCCLSGCPCGTSGGDRSCRHHCKLTTRLRGEQRIILERLEDANERGQLDPVSHLVIVDHALGDTRERWDAVQQGTCRPVIRCGDQ